MMLNVGIIGCGEMGEVHARHLQSKVPGACVLAVMDSSPERLQTVSNICGACDTYTDATSLIENRNVDAVVIASPDPTHAQLGLQCLEAGKPTLCEKPLATTEADAKRVLDAEAAYGKRLLQVGFMREYDDAHLSLFRALSNPDLGRPLMFRSRAVNPAKDHERPIDDVITNSAIHEIHSARWLMQQEIESVFVQHVPYHPERPGTCRLMTLSLRFTDGALGTIFINSEGGYGHEVEVEITTERAQLNTGDTTAPVVRLGSTQSKAIYPTWRERFEAAYLKETISWVEAVSNGSLTGPSAWDGYRSLVVAEACKKSARSGKRETVLLAEKPNLYG